MYAKLIHHLNPGLIRRNEFVKLACSRAMQTQPRIALVQGQTTSNKEFWSKNKDLARPMSPHLTIYKPQLTSSLSIFHRITGLGVSVVLYGGGIGALFCNQSFPEIIQLAQATIPHTLFILAKTAIGGAIIYHTLNGVRHLFWDVGYGFQLKHLYLSGYIVVALTALGTGIVFIKA